MDRLNKIKTENQFIENVIKHTEDFRTWDTEGIYTSIGLLFNYCTHKGIKCEYVERNCELFEELKPLNLSTLNKKRKKLYHNADLREQAIRLLLEPARHEHKQDEDCGLTNFFNELRHDIENKIKK